MVWLHTHIVAMGIQITSILISVCFHVKTRQIAKDTQPHHTNETGANNIQESVLQTPSTLSSFSSCFSSFFYKSLSTQCALGAGNLSLLARNPGRRHANRHSQRLEGTLSPVVVVVAPQTVDVDGEASGLSKALYAVGDHLRAELAEELALEAQFDNGVRSVGEVDDGAREGLVQRGVGVAETGDAGQGAEGFTKGVADGEAAVFGSVVVVN